MENNLNSNKGPICPEICIESLKKGDEKAFVLFVSTYQDMVVACCRSAGLTGADIEDAASETFFAAFRSIHRFKGQSKLSSWLWTIAYRKAVNIYLKNRDNAALSHTTIDTAAAELINVCPNSIESEEQSEAIWQTVQKLPENWAPVVVLFYREEKPISEIAEILNIPANTVKTYLDRSRKQLYELLKTTWKNDYVKN
jgi:RNA polymerase sigma factor (sigma-70 family)